MSIENLKTFGKSLRHSPPFWWSRGVCPLPTGARSAESNVTSIRRGFTIVCGRELGNQRLWMVLSLALFHLDLHDIFVLAG